MRNFKLAIDIKAQSYAEAEQVKNALSDMQQVSDTDDILHIARKIKSKPSLVKKARKFI